MQQVMTVLGPIDPTDLGVTYLHEHIMADCSFSADDPNKKFDDVEEMIGEMAYFLAAGGRTIVELTCRGLKPDLAALRRISLEGGVQIVAATGFYRECQYPEYVQRETIDQLAQRMMKDINQGVDGAGIRPGIIAELAAEPYRPGLSELEEKVFRAAGKVSLATGLAISTHCWEGLQAMDMIRVLKDEGVKLDRIVIGHLAVAHGLLDKAIEVADSGAYLGIDAIGYDSGDCGYDPGIWGDADRAAMVKTLIDRGYLNQITVSQDMMRRSFLKSRGGHGYSHLLTSFLPMLREHGVTDDQIHTMLVDTPRRVLTGESHAACVIKDDGRTIV